MTLLDDATVALIHALGGVSAIAISHPHDDTTMLDGAAAFDAPVWLHEADRACVVRPGPAFSLAARDKAIASGPDADPCAGTSDGGTMLHPP